VDKSENQEPWKDHQAQKILNTKLVKSANFKSWNKGVYFPDEEFPSELINLLVTHPLIQHFEAEFALYVANRKRSITPSDVEAVLKFILSSSKEKPSSTTTQSSEKQK